MKYSHLKIFMVLISCLLLSACGGNVAPTKPATPPAVKETVNADSLKPAIVSKPVVWNEKRQTLMKEYSLKHYGKAMDTIVPQAIVLHWTASNLLEGTYSWFYPVERDYKDGLGLNVGSHYLVDRDGTIYQLTPETALNRHIIGFNWCAIGVENVGGVDSKEDLTEAQVKANIALVKYLAAKYKTITHVFGHYQQTQAQKTALYIEKVPGYSSDKVDPGPIFMKKVHAACEDTGLKFFKE